MAHRHSTPQDQSKTPPAPVQRSDGADAAARVYLRWLRRRYPDSRWVRVEVDDEDATSPREEA